MAIEEPIGAARNVIVSGFARALNVPAPALVRAAWYAG